MDESFIQETKTIAESFLSMTNGQKTGFINSLLAIHQQAKDKDFLIIHNPGGWGNKELKDIQKWEMSILQGVAGIIENAGYSFMLTQYFRTGNGIREKFNDAREQLRFFTNKAIIFSKWLRLITRHLDNLKVILVGVSMGAAFGNAVMQKLNGTNGIYSIELGMFSIKRSRRIVTENTLVIDGNGIIPDATMEWNLFDMTKAFSAAPFRWLKHRLNGKTIKFSYCINSPGHDYNWQYPKVKEQISNFLNIHLLSQEKR